MLTVDNIAHFRGTAEWLINRDDPVGNLAAVEVGKDFMFSHGYIFLRDEVGCAYQAVGFDNSANDVP